MQPADFLYQPAYFQLHRNITGNHSFVDLLCLPVSQSPDDCQIGPSVCLYEDTKAFEVGVDTGTTVKWPTM